MRKLTWGLALGAVLTLHAATASADGGYGMAGCGLGLAVVLFVDPIVRLTLEESYWRASAVVGWRSLTRMPRVNRNRSLHLLKL